jgi:putative ABC transport system permease protein
MIRTARMPLLAPAQPRAWAQASDRAMRLQALAALGLITLGGLVGWLGSGLVAGFALLAGLLLGAALALPSSSAWRWRPCAPWPSGPFAEWVLADSRQQLPALSLSLMALLLALSANIGVATMVGSFRATFTGWLDQRLASELYVFTADTAEAARLADLPRRPRRCAPADPVGGGAALRASRRRSSASSIIHLPRGLAAPVGVGDPWGALYAGDGRSGERTDGAASRPVAGRSGDAVARPHAAGGGVYSDYGNPSGQAIVAMEVFRDLYPDAQATNFAIRVPPETPPRSPRSCGRSSACPRPPSATRRRSRPSRWRSSRTPSA